MNSVVGEFIEEKIVDSKGRLYLSSKLRGRRVYVVRRGDLIVLSTSRSSLVEALRKLGGSILDEYLRLLEFLGEPKPKEVEEVSRKRIWRKLRGY